MSILSALKTQTDSIDDLAALPQALIMQMAQKKQIREDMLAPILSRKAEMAEASARNQALKAQGQKPTVMEQLMQRNAVAEQPAPTEQTDVGIGQLPVNPGMFQEQSMAGGGIVAFEGGGGVNYEDPLMRLSGLSEEGMGADQARVVSDQARVASDQARKKLEEDRARYQFLKINAPESAARMLADNPLLEPGAVKKAVENKAVVEAKPVAPAGNVTTKVENKSDDKPVMNPLEDLFTRQEKLIESEREASKAAREEAKWMRLAEAGLGIASGDSPFALANLKGAMPALRGYGEDVAGLRKEERQRTKDLMEIQKERADVGYKDKLLKIQELAATKPDSTSQILALGRKAGLDDRALLGLLVGNKDTESSAKNIATKAYFENPVNAKQYGSLEKYLSFHGVGVQAQLPPGIPANSVQIGTSKGKPVYKAPDGKQYVVS
jgi:hypothetical protein